MNGQAVRALDPGDYFGEIVLIDHSCRLAKNLSRTLAPIVRYKPI
jgi:hypothetical protein